MVNPNHPKNKRARKRRRRDSRKSGDSEPPTEFWIEGQQFTQSGNAQDSASDTSYADVSLSPVPVAKVIAEANRIIEETVEEIEQVEVTVSDVMAENNQAPLDERLIEAIATRVEQKMTVKINTAVDEIKTTLGGRIKNLEEQVGRIDRENKKLKADIQALSVGGVDGDTVQTISEMVKDKVEEVMVEKQVLTKQPFHYDVTLAVYGLIEFPGENAKEVAEKLLRDGLRLPHLKVVNALRTPFNARLGKPGPFKIELEDVEAKKQALSVTGRLQGYTAQGNRIFVRASQTHEMRTMVGNMKTFLTACKLNNEYRVTKNGSVVPNVQRVDFQQTSGGLPAQQWTQGPQQQFQQHVGQYAQPPPPSQHQQGGSHMVHHPTQQAQHMVVQQRPQMTQPLVGNAPPRTPSWPNYSATNTGHSNAGLNTVPGQHIVPPVSTQMPKSLLSLAQTIQSTISNMQH